MFALHESKKDLKVILSQEDIEIVRRGEAVSSGVYYLRSDEELMYLNKELFVEGSILPDKSFHYSSRASRREAYDVLVMSFDVLNALEEKGVVSGKSNLVVIPISRKIKKLSPKIYRVKTLDLQVYNYGLLESGGLEKSSFRSFLEKSEGEEMF